MLRKYKRRVGCLEGFFFAIGEKSCESRVSSREDSRNAQLFESRCFRLLRYYAIIPATLTRQAKQPRMGDSCLAAKEP